MRTLDRIQQGTTYLGAYGRPLTEYDQKSEELKKICANGA